MNFLLPLLIGILFFAGTYLILHRNVLRLVIGFSLLSHATNLILIASGWIGRNIAPIDGLAAPEQFADPLPQALILTAIVISFGVTALLLILVLRIYREMKTIDVKKITKLKG